MHDVLKGIAVVWGIALTFFGVWFLLYLGMWIDTHATNLQKYIFCALILTLTGGGLGALGAFK